MALELAKIVTKLIQVIRLLGDIERGEDRLVNLFRGPAGDVAAPMQEDFQQPDDPGFMDFDAGIANRTAGNRKSLALQRRDVHMDVEPLRLAAGETVGDDLKLLAHRLQMVQTLLQAEVAQVVGAQFIAQERGELLVWFEERILPVGTVDVMAVLDPIDDRAELAAKLSGQTDPEDLADLVRGQAPQPQLAGTLKHFVNGKVAFEDEVAAVLDLVDGVEARQVHRRAFLLGELGT